MWKHLGLTRYGADEIVCVTLLAIATAAGLYVAFSPWLALLPIPVLAIGLHFFRDPNRKAPEDPGLWVSPADGEVTEMGEVREAKFIMGMAKKIGIFMSPFDVHVNRAPATGTIRYLAYQPGKFLDARLANSTEKNESQWVGLVTEPEDILVVVRQVSGVLARRIVCELNEGDRLARGDRFGMVKFGSRVELYVPVGAPVDIVAKLGQRVRAGETVVARVRRGEENTASSKPSATGREEESGKTGM